ncbi:MAG TPA: ABC transporter permease [Gemmatimonadaceae bacterium]|nr:ABC transporter permease [Gemmatimonadaceae bacterium]
MSAYRTPGDVRATTSFPVPQRAGIILFRQVSRTTIGYFRETGRRVYFLVETARAFGEPRTYLPLTMQQMRGIGVDSLPLTAIVAAFIGAVTAYQTYYQLFPGAGYSAVGLILRQSIVLELGPLLTALVLTGRVGARMTAEIGTMRVTEQIDALETLSYDPVAYLVVPRVIAGVVMLPLLTIVADAVGILAGVGLGIAATPVSAADFEQGLRLSFSNFQVVYSVIKATLFGAAIAFVCSYEGYVTEAGAEGVGRSTARAVVLASVLILVLDAITALFLAEYIGA